MVCDIYIWINEKYINHYTVHIHWVCLTFGVFIAGNIPVQILEEALSCGSLQSSRFRHLKLNNFAKISKRFPERTTQFWQVARKNI